eukprot:1351961-Pyramimonas_sp.AAC.1
MNSPAPQVIVSATLTNSVLKKAEQWCPNPEKLLVSREGAVGDQVKGTEGSLKDLDMPPGIDHVFIRTDRVLLILVRVVRVACESPFFARLDIYLVLICFATCPSRGAARRCHATSLRMWGIKDGCPAHVFVASCVCTWSCTCARTYTMFEGNLAA